MDPPSSAHFPCDWAEESDMEYETVSPPASIERSHVNKILDQPHEARFCVAITNLLHSKPAELTFAQLVDGLPLANLAFASRSLFWEKPVRQHDKLCPGVLDKVRAFRDCFDPADLELPVEVLRRYQNIPAGSRASKLPFIELVVVAVHRIAVLLHKEGSLHKDTEPDFEEGRLCHERDFGPSSRYYPTPFCLDDYSDPAQYPDGVADIAGYWAENWIFGGVVVFSRGESGTQCDDVWLHSCKKETTSRVWALTEDQLSRLLVFLESTNPPDCPLPIQLEKANQRRVDADNCIPEDNIYRDRWERKMTFQDRDTWAMCKSGLPDDDIHYPVSDSDGEPDVY